MILIDTPSPFADRAEWERFLADMLDMQRAHPQDQDVAEAIVTARAALTPKARTAQEPG